MNQSKNSKVTTPTNGSDKELFSPESSTYEPNTTAESDNSGHYKRSRRSIKPVNYSELDTDNVIEKPKLARRKSVFKQSINTSIEDQDLKVKIWCWT